MKPGIYPMPEADYHADPAPVPSLSSSIAGVLLARSPLHAWHAHPRLNPAYVNEDKEAFDLGRAAHALLLEGDDRMQVIDAENYRTKAAQEARDAARAAGKHPVLPHQYADVLAMREAALRAISDCADLSGLDLKRDGTPEQAVLWQEGDAWLRCRPDWLSTDRRVVIDYKSTTDATPAAFQRQIVRMGYHFQDAFYSRGLKAATGTEPMFVFLAQENTAPYRCSFHACGPSLRQIAEGEIDRAVKVWTRCIQTGKWPAYRLDIHYAEATAWQMAEYEEHANGEGFAYDPAVLFGGMKKEFAK
jgi:hypothetical protein